METLLCIVNPMADLQVRRPSARSCVSISLIVILVVNPYQTRQTKILIFKLQGLGKTSLNQHFNFVPPGTWQLNSKTELS